jgi:peptidyl-prolyl cis-trans isomerase SurA
MLNPRFAKALIATPVLLSLLAAAGRAEIIEQILVRVNGELFTKTDLEARQIVALREMGQRLDPTTANLDDAQLRKMLDQVTPELMVGVIDEMLLVQRGKELGYKLGDEQFAGILDNLKKENKIDNDEQFQAALKQEGMTVADLRRNVERRMLVSRVEQNEILGRIAVSEVEAREYYQAHVAEFTTPQSITLREIFVTMPENATPAQDAAAKEKASQIRQRASAGENFEKLAVDMSDAPSKANAGLIGPLNLSELSPDLRKLIESMKPGQISETLRTPRGYQLLKLETSTPPETMPFEQAKDQISDRVFTDKRREEYDKFLERLRGQAIIEWKNDELKRAYERGLGELKKQGSQAARG